MRPVPKRDRTAAGCPAISQGLPSAPRSPACGRRPPPAGLNSFEIFAIRADRGESSATRRCGQSRQANRSTQGAQARKAQFRLPLSSRLASRETIHPRSAHSRAAALSFKIGHRRDLPGGMESDVISLRCRKPKEHSCRREESESRPGVSHNRRSLSCQAAALLVSERQAQPAGPQFCEGKFHKRIPKPARYCARS